MAWRPFMSWGSPLKPCRHEPSLVSLPHPGQNGASQWVMLQAPSPTHEAPIRDPRAGDRRAGRSYLL